MRVGVWQHPHRGGNPGLHLLGGCGQLDCACGGDQRGRQDVGGWGGVVGHI